jgi:RimJ/RimL family protein N-acetyltransferase
MSAEPFELRAGTTVLRPLATEDAEHVVRWRSRPEVAAELFASKPPTRGEHDAWFASLKARTDRLEFVIVDDGAPVGTIGLSQIDLGAHTAEYGILIGEDTARGRGIAEAASRLVIQFAFESLGIERLDLMLFADNAPARRLYEKLGFVLREQCPAREKDGRMRPVELMSLMRSEPATRESRT